MGRLAAAVLLGAVLLAAPSRAGGKDGKEARRPDPGCFSCHSGIEVMHPWAPLSCIQCHGGEGEARDKAGAHVAASRPPPKDGRTAGLHRDLARRRFLNPGDLRVAEEVCGGCHADATAAVRKSLHATAAGLLSNTLYESGLVSDRRRRYAIFRVRDEDGTIPAQAYSALPALPAPRIRGETGLARRFADLPRKACLGCHLYSRGVGLRGRRGQDGSYRSEGCSACHVLYAEDGRSRSGDETTDHREPGHPVRHAMTAKIPARTCTTCHAREAGIAMSFRGLAQLPPGVPGGPGAQGTWNKLSKGHFLLRDPAICPPDIHAERGMACIDCHGAGDVMGDGNIYGSMEDAVGVECKTCHGDFARRATFRTRRGETLRHLRWEKGKAILRGKLDGKDHVIVQAAAIVDKNRPAFNPRAARAMDPILHGRLACYACHSGWSANFFGLHFDRNAALTQRDLLSGQRTPGRVSNPEKTFASFRHFYLGFDSEGRVAPYTAGFSAAGTFHDKKGVTVQRQALPVTAAGLSGLTPIPEQLHTVRPAARRCVECHASPSVLGTGTLDFQLFRDLFVVAGDAGLVVCGLDSKNPAKSLVLANAPLASQPRDVALRNDSRTGRAQEAYVACRDGSVQVVDLSDPLRPRRRGGIDAGDARRVAVEEGYLLIAAGGRGLVVASLENPRKPKEIARLETTEARAVFADGPWAYVADGPGGLRIIDLSDPAHPVQLAAIDCNGARSTPLAANDVLVHFQAARPRIASRSRTIARNIAYVADGAAGLYAVDVTDPTQPRLLAAFGGHGTGGPLHATALAFASNYDLGSADGAIVSAEREYLYLVGTVPGSRTGRLVKLDITDPDHPVVAGTRTTVGRPQGVKIARIFQPPVLKQFAVVAGRGGGNVEICDVTARTPAIPRTARLPAAGAAGGLDLEVFDLDRLVGFDGKPLKDIRRKGARFFTRREIARLLAVNEK